MDKESLFNLIHLYIDDQLEGKELEEFQHQIDSDPSIKDEIETQRKIRQAVILYSRKEKLNKIRALNKPQKLYKLRISKLAAALVPIAAVLLIIAFYYFAPSNPSDTLYQGKVELSSSQKEDILGSSTKLSDLIISKHPESTFINIAHDQIEINLVESEYSFTNISLEYLGGDEYLLILNRDSIYLKHNQ